MAKITIKDSEISSSANIHFSGSISGISASFNTLTNVTSINATTLSGTTGQFGTLTASVGYISGNLGVGITNPPVKLDVSGSTIFGKLLTDTHQFTGSVGVAGSLNVTGGITGSLQGTATQVSQTLTRGTYLTGNNYNGSSATTWAVDATNTNTASKIVARDGSGNFSAGIITATLAGTSSAVANSVTFNNGGSGAASGATYNGSVARTISYNTIGAPSTTGTGASGTWGINVTGNAATVTNGVYINSNNTFTGINTFNTNYITGSITGSDAKFTSVTGSFSGNGSNITNLNYSNVSNPPTIGNATITISAGNGLTTGGSFTTNQTGNSTITLNVGAGTGISVAAGTVGINTSVVPTLSANNTFTGTNTFSAVTASTIQVDTITAREFYTQLVTASVLYESGSTKFGDTQDDLHQFTGSIDITGSARTSNLIISQDVGSTVQPQIQFIGSASNPITLKVLDDNSLSFVNNSGNELFHLDADLTGTIFSVTDGSGIPSIEVEDTGDITLAEFGGNVGVGTSSPSYKLDVSGTLRVTGTSQFASVSGTLGQFNSLTVVNGSTSLAAVSGTIGEFTEITASVFTGSTGLLTTLTASNAYVSGNVGIGTNTTTDTLTVSGGVDITGSLDVTGGITGSLQGTATQVSQTLTRGSYLTGNNYNGSSATTWAVDATISNTGNKIVLRNAQGDFAAGVVTTTAIKNANGSQTAPSYTFTNDTNTGMFLGTTDELAFSTAGSERLRIDNNGNVGIGTTSPSAKLNIYGSSGDIFRADFSGSLSRVTIPYPSENYTARLVVNGGSEYTNTSYAVINSRGGSANSSAGSFGVNGYLDSSGAGVNFYSSGRISTSYSAWVNAMTAYNSTYETQSRYAINYISVAGTVSTRMLIDNSGNVGIGTTSPGAKLDVSGSTIFGKLLTDTHQFTGSIDITGSARTSNLIISPDAGSTVQPKIQFIGSSSNPIDLKVLDDNTLSFEGSAGQLFSISNNLTGGVIFSVSDVSGIPLLEADASGTVSMARFGTQVGIGTNATTDTLTISGGVDITGSLDVTGGSIRQSGSVTNYFLGNLGVGTSTTTDTLTISGGVDIIGSLSVDGYSSFWGGVAGILNQGINVRLGTSSGATWLITGTSNGTFRGGIQQLDGGSAARWYTNGTSQYAYLTSAGLSLSVGNITSPGAFYSSNGSQTAPSYTFTNDTNTGMFLGTTDELAFSTAGSERLRIDNNGNVGIGLTNPDASLTIARLTANGGALKVNGTSHASHFSFSTSEDTYIRGGKNGSKIYLNDTSGLGDVLIHSSNSNGKVGIGTTTPSARLDLSIVSTTTPALRLRNGGGDTSFTRPQIAFSYNNDVTYNHFINTRHNAGSPATGGNAIDFYVCDGTSGNSLSSGVIHNLTLESGRVGIGKTNPSAKLDVNGNTIITGSVDISGTLSATAKSFDIPHPTKDGMRLRYGSLEGGENAVYTRGITTSSVIDLPDHWTGLVDEETITVNLTPVGGPQQVWVEEVRDNKVILGGDITKCYYMVLGERKDIDKLVVEY